MYDSYDRSRGVMGSLLDRSGGKYPYSLLAREILSLFPGDSVVLLRYPRTWSTRQVCTFVLQCINPHELRCLVIILYYKLVLFISS